jgi:hypothetical protein
MTSPSELQPNKAKEGQQISLLSQIKIDVSNAIKAFPDMPQDKLIKDFSDRLLEWRGWIMEDLSPGAKGYEIMKTIWGNEFSSLSLREKIDTYIRVRKLDDKEKNNLATHVVTKLYEDYLTSKRPFSNEAWGKFVNAYKNFNTRCVNGEFISCYQDVFFYETYGVNLPTITDESFHSLTNPTKENRLKNTQLQEKFAKTAGFLNPDETFLDLIHRKNMKIVDFGYKASDLDKDLIIGELRSSYSNNFNLGNMPNCYENIPTKYQNTKAIVIFDKPYDDQKYNDKLDVLIQTGKLTPRIILVVPAREFAE